MSIVLNEDSDAQLVSQSYHLAGAKREIRGLRFIGTLAQLPRICKHALDEEAKAMQEEGCVSDE